MGEKGLRVLATKCTFLEELHISEVKGFTAKEAIEYFLSQREEGCRRSSLKVLVSHPGTHDCCLCMRKVVSECDHGSEGSTATSPLGDVRILQIDAPPLKATKRRRIDSS